MWKSKIKYVMTILSVVMILLCFLVACGNDTNKSKYQYGTFNGNIESEFELVEGTRSQQAISGGFETVCINYAQTEDGGWVAWKDNRYGYTSKSSLGNLCSSFALHFEYIKPTEF